MGSRPISRRAALAGAVCALGAGGCSPADRPGPPSRSTAVAEPAGAAPARSGRLDSAAMGRPCDWTVHLPASRPPGRLPVCVVLHGKGGDAGSAARIGFPQALDRVVREGVPAFALATVSGGNGYWHPRRDGTDAGAMVVDELLPLLAEQGFAASPADRVGLLGWSMGGFGALLLGRDLGPARVAAVGAVSAALWTRPGATAPGAFDDAEDYHRHDLFARPDAWRGMAVRLDCGDRDPFVAANRVLARRMRPAPVAEFRPGGHTDGYWRSTAPAQLRAIGTALAG